MLEWPIIAIWQGGSRVAKLCFLIGFRNLNFKTLAVVDCKQIDPNYSLPSLPAFGRAFSHWLWAGLGTHFGQQNLAKGMQTEVWKVLAHWGMPSCCPWDPCHHCQLKKAGQTLWVEMCDLDTSVASGNSWPLVRHAREASLDHTASGSPPVDQRHMTIQQGSAESTRSEQSSWLPELWANF